MHICTICLAQASLSRRPLVGLAPPCWSCDQRETSKSQRPRRPLAPAGTPKLYREKPDESGKNHTCRPRSELKFGRQVPIDKRGV